MKQRVTVRELAWMEICPGLILLRCFRLAISFRMLLLASAGTIALLVGWAAIAAMFSGSESADVSQWSTRPTTWPWRKPSTAGIFSQLGNDTDGAGNPADAANPVAASWNLTVTPGRRLLHPQLSLAGLAFNILGCVWAAAVWALFGGAMTRSAVVALAREEYTGVTASLCFARSKYRSLLLAPLLPLLGIAILAVPGVVLGLLMRTGLGLLLAAVVWPLVLLTAFFLVLLLVGLAVGWPLLYAALAAEGKDAFDAISRMYAYVYQRPIQFGLYVAAASLWGIVGWLVVGFFADGVLQLTNTVLGLGAGSARMADLQLWQQGEGGAGFLSGAGAWLIALYANVIATVRFSFATSFFFAAAAAIYLLLRRSLDATEMDDVYCENTGQPLGLPTLGQDESGAPTVEKSASHTKNVSADAPGGSAADEPSTDGDSPASAARNEESPETTS